MYEKTIRKELTFEGLGVHYGEKAVLTLYPRKEKSGICIKFNGNITKISEKMILKSKLCTSIQIGDYRVSTIEHLLSSLYGLGISNILIEINGREIPILDGSSYEFVKKLLPNIQIQNTIRKVINLNKVISINNDDNFILAIPSNKLEIIYIIDYGNKLPEFMFHKFVYSNENYINEISKSRTYGYLSDAEYLRKNGLALGANYENTLVINENSYSSELRYFNEPVRHKILDLLGDITFLGKHLNSKIVAYKTGHNEHLELVEKILKLS